MTFAATICGRILPFRATHFRRPANDRPMRPVTPANDCGQPGEVWL